MDILSQPFNLDYKFMRSWERDFFELTMYKEFMMTHTVNGSLSQYPSSLDLCLWHVSAHSIQFQIYFNPTRMIMTSLLKLKS